MDGSSVRSGQKDFDFLLDRECKRALRTQTPISMFLIDVDFFKEYEAHEGQAACINCLHLVGEVLRICVKRDLDFIANNEMHNFVCLLPDTDADGARRICKLIQEKVAQLNIPHPCSPIADHVTLIIGAATVKPTFKLNQDQLVHQAEISLEEARNYAHNMVRR
jgi:diguanylate cyclase (GGDEF)-like protein